MGWYTSGVFLGCKIRAADFCSLQKFSLTLAKIFEAHLKNFSKTLNIKFFVKKWVLTKMEKILRLQNFFLIMQKFLQPRESSLLSMHILLRNGLYVPNFEKNQSSHPQTRKRDISCNWKNPDLQYEWASIGENPPSPVCVTLLPSKSSY